MSIRDLATRLSTALELDLPPIALAFRDTAPDGVATTDAVVPSACTFWRRAETGVFFAPAAAHFNCPVGAFVMGFPLPPEVARELEGLIGTMGQAGYLGADEPAHIPTVPSAPAGLVYGPLERFPVAPDAVLVWLPPVQAMIWQEATGAATWTPATAAADAATCPSAGPARTFGRPACAAIPAALAAQAGTLSFGCIGMRTFTGIDDGRMLAVAPGRDLERVVAAVETAVAVNRTMQRFYQERQRAVLGG